METYLPNTNVAVEFSIPQDTTFVSGKVSIYDENEALIHDYDMNAGDYGMVSYMLKIDAGLNDIGEAQRGLRIISMLLTDADGTVHSDSQRYYLTSTRTLKKGVNSIVSYVNALMLVPDISKLDGWYGASEEEHTAALVESYDTLSRFPLNKRFAHSNITLFSESELNTLLTQRERSDFAKAQILHANYLLGGEPEKSMRDSGVMSNSVGESTTFFRTSMPLDYGISSRAYRYISRYINRDVVIRNA